MGCILGPHGEQLLLAGAQCAWVHDVQPQEGIGVYHEDVEARGRGGGSVSWLRIWVWPLPPLIVWTDGSLDICKKDKVELEKAKNMIMKVKDYLFKV